MSHSKQTANYGLPLFEPKDRPAWLTDFNGAMTAVDATVKGLEESIQAGGITQEQADARYLQLSGGTMTGDLKVQESPASDASAVSKSYAQGLAASAISTANAAKSTAEAAKTAADAALPKSGGTMTGNLILNGAPTADNQAATKAYVDAQIAANITAAINASY